MGKKGGKHKQPCYSREEWVEGGLRGAMQSTTKPAYRTFDILCYFWADLIKTYVTIVTHYSYRCTCTLCLLLVVEKLMVISRPWLLCLSHVPVTFHYKHKHNQYFLLCKCEKTDHKHGIKPRKWKNRDIQPHGKNTPLIALIMVLKWLKLSVPGKKTVGDGHNICVYSCININTHIHMWTKYNEGWG